MSHIHDVIIIGGGPGGYTAALYAARAGLDTIVVERLSAGGQMALTTQIDNYSGFEEGVDGFSLGLKMQAGAERFGAKTILADVLHVRLSGLVKEIRTSEGIYLSRTVILATGAGHKHLGIEGEDDLVGRGLGYCAACDGMFYRGKTVAVIGGGNTAAADALLLSRVCKKVYVIHRRDTLRATKIYHESLFQAENVEFIWNSQVEELLSKQSLSGLKIRNVISSETSTLPVDGVFVSIGRQPATELVKDQLDLDPSGYIIADESTQTSIPGVFAVGDVRTKTVRQVITAAGDGATAVHFVEEYLAALPGDHLP